MKTNGPFDPSQRDARDRELGDALEGYTLLLEGKDLPRPERKSLQKLSGDPEFEAVKRFLEATRQAASLTVSPSPSARIRMEETVLDRFRDSRSRARASVKARQTAAASPLPAGTDSELAQPAYLEGETRALRAGVPASHRTVGSPDSAARASRSDAVRVYLEVSEGSGSVRDIEVTLYDAVFGRGDVPFRLDDDPQVSRQHARIILLDGYVVVQDLDSRNGSYVNGLRILEPTRLEPGDVLELGRSRLTLDRVEPLSPGYARAVFASDDGSRYTLHLSECLLGRSRRVTIPLEDDSRRLSRRHARLDLSDGRVFLTDLGSTNGVVLDRSQIDGSVVLESDTAIQLGSVALRVVGFARA